jgi:hypothetical protein
MFLEKLSGFSRGSPRAFFLFEFRILLDSPDSGGSSCGG